jgi:hypothetical protein
VEASVTPASSGICPHLRPLLDGELAVGNRIGSREKGPLRPDAVVVMLASPFTIDYTIRRPVVFERLNDPHWWGAEYRCTEHGHQLLCPVHGSTARA